MSWLSRLFTTESYPFPPGSQNRDGFERNADNPLWGDRSEGSVLRLSAAWACVRLLASTISTLPLNMYERVSDNQRRLATDFQLYPLLHDQPNADMTAQIFWEAYMASLLLRGRAYGWKRYGTQGQISAIDFLPPDQTSRTRQSDGSWLYRYVDKLGQSHSIPERDIFATIGFTLDGIEGLSPIAYGAGVFTSAIGADTAANNVMRRGLMSTIAFSMEQVIKKDQRKEFRDNYRQDVAGALNAGKPLLLEGGMKATPLSINPKDAQLLESRAWSIEEICRWFAVPPFMIGHAEKSTSWGTGIEQQQIGFLTFALRPWLKRIEQSIRKDLLTTTQQGRYYAEFAIDALLRADTSARSNLYSSAGQNGWMTRNEIRALENLPPMAGGDVLTAQSNLLPLAQLGDNPVSASDAIKQWLGIEVAQ